MQAELQSRVTVFRKYGIHLLLYYSSVIAFSRNSHYIHMYIYC